jgi:hypothetical protein
LLADDVEWRPKDCEFAGSVPRTGFGVGPVSGEVPARSCRGDGSREKSPAASQDAHDKHLAVASAAVLAKSPKKSGYCAGTTSADRVLTGADKSVPFIRRHLIMNIPSRWVEALVFLITALVLSLILDDAGAATASRELPREFRIGYQKFGTLILLKSRDDLEEQQS